MIFVLFSIVFGLIVGSGLTALIPRLAADEPWHRGRSHCPRCRHTLAPRDLMPLVSFFVNRGRCRHCQGAIGWFYPGVELATAALFVIALVVRSGGDLTPLDAADSRLWLTIFRDWLAIAVLLALFGIDLIAQVLPDAITLPAVGVFFIWNLALGESPGGLIAGALFGACFFLLQYLVSRGAWIGGGDIRLGALLGALVGWPGILLALFSSYLLGASVGLGQIAVGSKSWKSRVPFGTYLAAGGLFTLFLGEKVIAWYLGKIL